MTISALFPSTSPDLTSAAPQNMGEDYSDAKRERNRLREGGERGTVCTPLLLRERACVRAQLEAKQIKGSENHFNWCSFETRGNGANWEGSEVSEFNQRCRKFRTEHSPPWFEGPTQPGTLNEASFGRRVSSRPDHNSQLARIRVRGLIHPSSS